MSRELVGILNWNGFAMVMFAAHEQGAIISISNSEVLIASGHSEWKTAEEIDPSRPSFYFPDFFLSYTHPWLQFENNDVVSIDSLKKQMAPSQSLSLKWIPPKKNSFDQTFYFLKDVFKNSDVKKVVAYDFFENSEPMTFPRLQHFLFHALHYIEEYPTSIYGFWTKKDGMLGVTPELLFDKQGNTLLTMALAGTVEKEKKLKEIPFDSKLMKEHQLVAKDILTSMQKVGKVNMKAIELLTLSNLAHLMTTIGVTLHKEMTFEEIVRLLHPTPALGVYPREKADALMKWLETRAARGRYGAPVGVQYDNRSLCYVGIRNVQWDTSGLKVGVGSGIVEESDCQEEWNEMEKKFCSVKAALAL